MEINDEMIACYVEGKLNIEERNFVRRYLSKNPEKMETLLYMMDDDREDFLDEIEEESNDTVNVNETFFSEIAYSAAAFVPQQKKKLAFDKKRLNTTDDFLKRLGKLCDDVYD